MRITVAAAGAESELKCCKSLGRVGHDTLATLGKRWLDGNHRQRPRGISRFRGSRGTFATPTLANSIHGQQSALGRLQEVGSRPAKTFAGLGYSMGYGFGKTAVFSQDLRRCA